MTPEETKNFFKMIVALYPRDTTFANAPVETVRAWHMMIEDIPADTAAAALKAHSASSPFPPSIAEIRQFAAKAQCAATDWEDAYKLARDTRRKYGWPDAKGAKESLSTEVWNICITMYGTWEQWCTNEDPEGVERAQFKEIWNARKGRAQQAAALPPSVTETMKRLAGGLCLPESEA